MVKLDIDAAASKVRVLKEPQSIKNAAGNSGWIPQGP
jgi:hypothetical protein